MSWRVCSIAGRTVVARSCHAEPSACVVALLKLEDPIQVSQMKRQLLENASELFGPGKNNKDKEAGEAKEAELFQQYCFADA
jgi:hypothetical protein